VFIIRPRRFLGCALVAVATYLPLASAFAVQTPDSEYEAIAEEFIRGYFAARPLLGTASACMNTMARSRITAGSRSDAELSRLKRFDDRLQKFELNKLSQRQSIDLRILQAAVRNEIFQREAMAIYERNPIVYAARPT